MPDCRFSAFFQSERSGSFLTNEDGATAIEYAMIASLLSMVIIGSVATLGGGVSAMWDFVLTSVVGGLTP